MLWCVYGYENVSKIAPWLPAQGVHSGLQWLLRMHVLENMTANPFNNELFVLFWLNFI